MKHKIVLASTSPFRKKLMNRLEIDFLTDSPLADEEELKKAFQGDPQRLCAHLAKEKALSLKDMHTHALIIGSDQSLFCDNQILGKGHNFEGAFQQLKFCSGKKTDLITSVYMHDTEGDDLNFENQTTLKFKTLSDEEITKYLEWDQPYKCAGSFKFESKGSFLFKNISCSDPSAIEGLPMIELVHLLKEKGVVFKFI